MKYSDLVKNRVAVEQILKCKSKNGNSLFSEANGNYRFELNLEKANTTGDVNLVFHAEGEKDILAVVNLKNRKINVLGSEVFEISSKTTEVILKRSFDEALRMGSH